MDIEFFCTVIHGVLRTDEAVFSTVIKFQRPRFCERIILVNAHAWRVEETVLQEVKKIVILIF